MADKNCIILEKIIGHIDKIISYVGDMDQATFLADTKLVEACVFNLLSHFGRVKAPSFSWQL